MTEFYHSCPDAECHCFDALVEALRHPVTTRTAKTWTFNPCTCDYLADEHEPDCPSLTPPYTVGKVDA